jgi:putative tricarboxylic transport membrane protein
MRADRVGGLISIICGAVALSEGMRLYPARITTFAGDHTLPLFVGAGLIALGLYLLLIKGQTFKVQFPDRKLLSRMLLALGLLVVYWLSIPYLGYPISTFLISIGLFKVIGSYSYLRSIIFSAVLTAAVYVLFIFWLAMAFPTGIFDI